MRRIQHTLSENNQDVPYTNELAATALKDKRLTLTWMDGEVQKVSMFFSTPAMVAPSTIFRL